MSLPEFTPEGELPAGVYAATLAEVIGRLGKPGRRRKALARRLTRIYELALATGELRRFVVFGSFVTAKTIPNDVDVFMIMSDNFKKGELVGETRLLFEHSAAQSRFGCSVFWMRQLAAIGGEQAAVEDWQITREGTERGIIELIGQKQK